MAARKKKADEAVVNETEALVAETEELKNETDTTGEEAGETAAEKAEADGETTTDNVELANTENGNADETEESEDNEGSQPQASTRVRRRMSDMAPEEQIQLKASRSTHSVSLASKELKDELYSHERVITEYGDDEVNDDSSEKRKEWLELVASAKEDKILKGKVVSLTTVATNHDPDDEDYIPAYMARVQYGHGYFDIKIPSYLLYDYNLSTHMTKYGAESIRRNISRRIGSEIKFVVRHTDERTGEVIADRLGAMSMEGIANYTSRTAREPRIVPGRLVKARIVANARDYITVDALGAEFNIMNEELSHFFIGDVRDYDGINTDENYSVGADIIVKITGVEIEKVQKFNNTYSLVKAAGSVKATKRNPRDRFYDKFKVNDTWAGVVTGITESGVYVNLGNMMECLCSFPIYGNNPMVGDTCKVKVTFKDDEKKFVYGVFQA